MALRGAPHEPDRRLGCLGGERVLDNGGLRQRRLQLDRIFRNFEGNAAHGVGGSVASGGGCIIVCSP